MSASWLLLPLELIYIYHYETVSSLSEMLCCRGKKGKSLQVRPHSVW